MLSNQNQIKGLNPGYAKGEFIWQTQCSYIRIQPYTLNLKALDDGSPVSLADINNIPSQKILLKTGYKEIKQMPLWGLDVYYYEMDLT